LAPFLLLALVAGLAAVERKGFLQAMLSRPVVLGPVAGLAMGDAAAGLLVGAPLELLWLGAVNLGAALPLHEALGTAAIAGGAALAGDRLGTPASPAVAAVAFAACAPLALAGRRADALVERLNERLAARASRKLAEGDPRAAVRCNLFGLLLPFAISAALAPLGALAAGALAPALLRGWPGLEGPLRLAFAALAGLACAAGAKAMRARSAAAWFYGSALAGLAVLWLAGGRAP
jgi:PTS system mannose-specific IIC component